MIPSLPTIRLRNKIPKEELDRKLGKIITDDDINILLTGPSRVLKPNGEPLAIYLPKAIPENIANVAYPILHTIQGLTDNRGLASGSERVMRGKTSRANSVKSSIIGYFDPYKNWHPFCRTTAWTGSHAEKFGELIPLFENCGDHFKEHVPDRYAVQKRRCDSTKQEWVIGNSPFTTITVNNTYPTGVHVDAGDLVDGFSNLACLRRGEYTGGILTFPEFRLGIDLQDRDLVLMDPHEWHGNTALNLKSDDAERISLVLYYRTNMLECGTAEEEILKSRNQIKWWTEEELEQMDVKSTVKLGKDVANK